MIYCRATSSFNVGSWAMINQEMENDSFDSQAKQVFILFNA